MSLFGMLYPMCFEYVEMVRFYHAVYRVVYHPQVCAYVVFTNQGLSIVCFPSTGVSSRRAAHFFHSLAMRPTTPCGHVFSGRL